MGVQACEVSTKDVLRVLFLVVNALFWAVSLGIVGYLAFHVATMPTTAGFLLGHAAVLYSLLVNGSALFVIGMVGYCTGVRLNISCIKAYIILVAIFMGLNFGLMVYLIQFSLTEADYKSTWLAETETQNGIQVELTCCGYSSPADYMNTSLSSSGSSSTNSSSGSSSSSVVTDGDVNLDLSCYNVTVNADISLYEPYVTGCSGSLETTANTMVRLLMWMTVAVFVIQVGGLAVATVILQKLRVRTYDEEVEKEEDSKPKQKYKMIKGGLQTNSDE